MILRRCSSAAAVLFLILASSSVVGGVRRRLEDDAQDIEEGGEPPEDGGDALPDHVSSKLMVHIPHSLFKDGGYDHREALFGFPPYGGSIAQNVYYADSKLCDSGDIDATKGYPEREDKSPWPSPYILMVDRGDCTFVQKVRNAQRTGAAGVLIADNTCLCDAEDCESEPNVQCESAEPIMADDGSGADISIPSFLLFKTDADKIKGELRQNRPVQVEMKWSLPAPDNRVEYELWTTPTDKVSYEFLKNFKAISVALGDRAYFTPHQYIYDGIKSHCKNNDGESFCYNLCTNNGRYCATDPDNDLEKGISGADVVKESLRRLCVWTHYGAADGVGERYWDYVVQFMERCNDPDYFANQDCIEDVYNHASVNGEAVEQCMKDSGDVSRDVTNNKLDAEIDYQIQRGVVVIPTSFVNAAAIRGALTPSNIFTAICAGYSEDTAPEICSKCSRCHDVNTCAQNGICSAEVIMPSGGGGGGSSGDGVSKHTFGSTMLFVIVVFGGLAAWHYKRTREEMRDQVRGILAEYMPLEDQDSPNGARSNPMDFAAGGTGTSLMT